MFHTLCFSYRVVPSCDNLTDKCPQCMSWPLPPPGCKVASLPIYPSLRQAPGESSGCAASAEGHGAEQGERGAQRPQHCLAPYGHTNVPRGPGVTPSHPSALCSETAGQNPRVLLQLFLGGAELLLEWLQWNRPNTHQTPAPGTDAQAESSKDGQGYQSSSISVSTTDQVRTSPSPQLHQSSQGTNPALNGGPW